MPEPIPSLVGDIAAVRPFRTYALRRGLSQTSATPPASAREPRRRAGPGSTSRERAVGWLYRPITEGNRPLASFSTPRQQSVPADERTPCSSNIRGSRWRHFRVRRCFRRWVRSGRGGSAQSRPILVRPDGFIGFSAAPADEATMATLDAHLATYLVPQFGAS
jgi:hypothetical protein